MALSGIQIYKMLPQTNCKECGFPTCLAFAMKLAAKQVELSACPYVTEENKAQLAESSAPPIRLVTLKGADGEVKAGNEVVMYRHEKTFYNKPGLFIRVKSADGVAEADAYKVNYVGMDFTVDGFAVEADTSTSLSASSPAAYAETVKAVRAASGRPLILLSKNPDILQAGLAALPGEKPLLCGADASNWEKVAELAKASGCPLAVSADTIDGLAGLTEKIKAKGVEDLVLDPMTAHLGKSLAINTQLRRLALKNTRSVGYPILAFPCDAADELAAASQAIAKYAGFVVLSEFRPELLYALLVLRENIYTDPQKPIQVQPGIYEINAPKPESPVLVTTNFSITYFAVANEVEGSGLPAWLVVCDAEGMSVLTAWAAGKFDAERIAKAIKGFNIADKISQKRVVLPGHVAVLSGELEAELPDWEIRVGPREAVDLPAFMKQALN